MSSSPQLRYPDFLCIGAQKAGTTWLHRMLRRHPDLWLPPFKEIQYFNRAHPHDKADPRSAAAHETQRLGNILNAMKATLEGSLPDAQKQAQVYCLSVIARAELSDEWYGRIFQNAPNSAVCGEISPDYAVLTDIGIEHIIRLQPEIRIIFIMRDPIERGWSQLRMGEARGLSERVPHLRRIAGPQFLAYSDYASTIERFRRRVPSKNFLELFFDDISARPDDLLNELCAFLGVDPARTTFAAAHRPVNVGQPGTMDDETYARFRVAFAPLYEKLLQLQYPVADQWYQKHYGQRSTK
jgi:hypothetical protein